MQKDIYAYDDIRKNYELDSAFWWLVAAVAYGVYAGFAPFPGAMFAISAVCTFMGVLRAIPGIKRYKQTVRLAGAPLPSMQITELAKVMKDDAHKNDIWLGKGFRWGQSEAQRAYQIMRGDWQKITLEALGSIYLWRFFLKHKGMAFIHPFKFFHLYKEQKNGISGIVGQPWIHGCGPSEKPVYLPIPHTEGHTLIIGTTGAGKTRCFDLIICQAIMRNETVIIIDPKGDNDLQAKVERACKELHREKDFYSFHPGHPEKSIRLNLLANWTEPSELASRVAALMPVGGNSDPFTGFAWLAINSITQAYCKILKEAPTLENIRACILGDMPSTVCKVLKTYLEEKLIERYGEEHGKKTYSSLLGTIKQSVQDDSDQFAEALVKHYRALGMPSSEVEGLLQMYEHDATHFSKMITSLLPILSMLTSGEVGAMLSPGKDNKDIAFSDLRALISGNCVLYVGLSNLRDKMVGSAIGSLVISDIASVAGSRYDYDGKKDTLNKISSEVEDSEETPAHEGIVTQKVTAKEAELDLSRVRPVNVFVDEANEVANLPLLQLLNKGRGAAFRLYLATQTIADFAAVLGSQDRATQFLGNMNNVISLRLKDTKSSQFVSENFPKTSIVTVQHSQTESVGNTSLAAQGGSLTQRRDEREADLFPESLLTMLPPLEFIAHLAGGNIIKGRFPLLLASDDK